MTFAPLYMQQRPPPPSNEEIYADLLWSFYHYRCELFDSKICIAKKDGVYIFTSQPVYARSYRRWVTDQQASIANARKELDRILFLRHFMSISEDVWVNARDRYRTDLPLERRKQEFLYCVERFDRAGLDLSGDLVLRWIAMG